MTHLHRSPIDAIGTGAGGGRPYNTAARQRACILAVLTRGPASRRELETECGAPCVTKRISELRERGFDIRSSWAPMRGPGGTASVTTVYHLATPDDRQADLFEPAPTEGTA